jgi:dATP pyrophosphohydrolase
MTKTAIRAIIETPVTPISEHTDHKWLMYKESCRLMKYEGNKIALWELDKRLKTEETG